MMKAIGLLMIADVCYEAGWGRMDKSGCSKMLLLSQFARINESE
jgi:hypothetical protein